MTATKVIWTPVAYILLFSLSAACEPSATTQTRRRAREGYIPPSKAIYHPDWKRRKDAVDVLAEGRDNRSLALLSIALKDKDARVRAAAIKALGARKDRSSLGAIAKAMQDPDERVRLAALGALQEITGIQAVSIALHRLGAGSERERLAVVDCLAKQLRTDKSANRGKMIKRLVIMVKAERPQTQKDAGAVLAKIGGVATYVLLNALAAARPGSHGDWMGRIEAILLKVGKPALKSLIQAIQYASDGEAQARAAVAPLARIGKAAVPSLVLLLDWRKKYSHLTGTLAADALRRIGQPAAPATLRLLKDKRADRRLIGVQLLGKLGGRAATDGLLALLVAEKHTAVLTAAVRGLGDLKVKRAIKPILTALARDRTTRPTSARYSAYRSALTSLQPAAAPLIEALKSPQTQVRLVAAQVVGSLKTAGAAEALVALLADRSPAVLASAAWALGFLKEKAAVKGLSKLTRHKDTTVRIHAVAALGRIGAKRAFFAVNGAARTKSIALKITAVLAMGRMSDRRGKKTIRKLGWMPYPAARDAAKWAKARIRGKAPDGPQPTRCGLLQGQQHHCRTTHPAVMGYDFVGACRFGDVSQWEPLLKATNCEKLARTAERLAQAVRGVTLESWWDKAKKSRYQKVILWAGQPHGRVQRWYANGQPMMTGQLTAGKRNGQWTAFWDSGKRRWESFYTNGQKTGKWKRWYDDGTLREEGILENGSRKGAWIENHENGQKAMVLSYVGGKLEGKQISHYTNGTKSGEALYKAGRRQGAWQTWYTNGAKRSKGQYAAGQRTGAWIWWYNNGTKREEGTFAKGIKAGTWKSYDKHGVVVETCDYGTTGTPKCNK